MKVGEWNQQILLVTKDLEIQSKIAIPFGKESELIVVQNTSEAIDKLTLFNINCLIIDTKCTDPDLHYTEESSEISFLEITQYANQVKNGIVIIVLVNLLKADAGNFAKKCGASLIMDRKDISLNLMVYIIRVLRRRTFRTILLTDLIINQVVPVDIYHYLPINGRYALAIQAGMTFSTDKKEKFLLTNIHHLYVKEEDLAILISSLKNSKVDLYFSREMASVRLKYKNYIIQFFDFSTDGNIHYGKKLYEEGLSIVEHLKSILKNFSNPFTALIELPYPRWSALAHGINSAIYALIFAPICKIENADQIAYVALIHNLGLTEINQEVLKKKESDLTQDEFIEYKKHIQKTIEIIQKKRMVIPPIIEKMIKEHHENFDGTGFPEGLAGTYLCQESALLAIIGSFDYFNTVRVGEKKKNIIEAWEILMQYHVEATAFKKKFNPVLLEIIENFLKSGFSPPQKID